MSRPVITEPSEPQRAVVDRISEPIATLESSQGIPVLLGLSKLSVRIAVLLSAVIILVGIVNATLMYDYLYLVKFFRVSLDQSGLLHTLNTLFFNLDLGPNQYRLYGLSRVIHMVLWSIFGSNAWGYAAFICIGQVASAWGIYVLLRRFRADPIQSAVVTFAWAFSL